MSDVLAARAMYPSMADTAKTEPPRGRSTSEDGTADAAAKMYTGPEKYEDVFERRDRERREAVERERREADAKAKPDSKAAEPLDVHALAEAAGADPDHAATREFVEIASDLKLDNDGAKRLAEFDMKRRTEFWDGQHAAWEQQSMREFDEAARALANDGLRQIADDELYDLLGQMRLASHPAVVRAMVKLGNLVKGRS